MYKDDTWSIMNELGKLNQLHFLDLNKDSATFDLPYINNIKASEDSLRKIE